MKRSTTLTAVVAALAAALPGIAAAGITSEGGGDYSVVPLYRALVFGGVDRDGDGGYAFDDIDGLDYVSNFAPKSVATTNGSFAADGATMTTHGWAAYSGFYASRDYASMSVSNANAAASYYLVAGQGSATSVQFFSAEVAAASATFTFHISGSESNPSGLGLSTSRLDFAASTDPTKNWLGLFDGSLASLSVLGAGTYTYTLPVTDLGTTINLYFWTSAFTQVLAGEAAQGSSFTMTADYGHTFVLDDVQLYGADSTAVSQWSLQDTMGGETLFTQDGRITPVLPAPPVPEPGTWALMLVGLAALTHVARRASPRPVRAAGDGRRGGG